MTLKAKRPEKLRYVKYLFLILKNVDTLRYQVLSRFQ